MSATEELRALLDGRGVDYADIEFSDRSNVLTWCSNDMVWYYVEEQQCLFGENVTPKQAVDATLGTDPYEAVASEHVITAGQLHSLLDEWDKHPGRMAADEELLSLGATLGRGECEWQLVKSGPLYIVCRCSACGYEHSEGMTDAHATDFDPRFCPRCGNAVKR